MIRLNILLSRLMVVTCLSRRNVMLLLVIGSLTMPSWGRLNPVLLRIRMVMVSGTWVMRLSGLSLNGLKLTLMMRVKIFP